MHLASTGGKRAAKFGYGRDCSGNVMHHLGGVPEQQSPGKNAAQGRHGCGTEQDLAALAACRTRKLRGTKGTRLEAIAAPQACPRT